MQLAGIDWIIIGSYLALSLGVGLWVSRRAGRNTEEFFLSGRKLSWYFLGISMVATTFAADTPNLVTEIVRKDGVSGNWVWWAFLLSGMLTVFVFARLWHRAGVMTDIEYYELRYSGSAAAFLRGFRAIYLGLVFNVLVMGNVSLAAVKFGEIILGLPGWQTLLLAGTVTIIYSTLGGLRAVVITDFIQFGLAMIGSIWACIYLLDHEQVGGLTHVLAHPAVADRLSLIPDLSQPDLWVPLLLIPLAVTWWASYYPGSEPGGGGYIAQRMFSAKSETHAVGATLLYNVAHYALRPWPWILIALASLVVFPEVSDIATRFPNLSAQSLGDDIAYPAMLTLLPVGLVGLVAASLIAAFMSTMSTQVNLGASYLVNDFYRRFIKPSASEKELVFMGRVFSLLSILLGLGLGLILKSAKQAFDLVLLIGAGTGLIYILRWFWWRINAYSELVAMFASVVFAGFMTFLADTVWYSWQVADLSFSNAWGQVVPEAYQIAGWLKFLLGTGLTTLTWLIVTYLTPATEESTLRNYYEKVRPAGRGWQRFRSTNEMDPTKTLPVQILMVLLGSFLVYAALFALGYFLYGAYTKGLIASALLGIGIAGLFLLWKRVQQDTE